MKKYFLYILDNDPSKVTGLLNKIVAEANKIGFEVVSGIWTLKGRYRRLVLDVVDCLKEEDYDGFSFKDTGGLYSGSSLEFPPVCVCNNENSTQVYEKPFKQERIDYGKIELDDNLEKSFETIRSIDAKLIGEDRVLYSASDSVKEGIKFLQLAEELSEPILYVPSVPSCQNLVDGPFQLIEKTVVVVDWTKTFRDYANYRIVEENSIEEVLRELYEI